MIVPWNFPFWIPFKSMIPPFVAGNPILLKQAPATPLCSLAIHKLFTDGGFVDGEFTSLFLSNEQAAGVLADPRIGGIKFTGSTNTGKVIGEIAGRNMKPACFELGGSDAFIVMEDSNLDLAVEKGYLSRMNANGQACINAKRFIIHEKIYDQFREKMIDKIKSTAKLGDPMDAENVTVGPLVNK